MKLLPDSDLYLLVRTYYADNEAWSALRAVVDAETAEGFAATVLYVEDSTLEGSVVDDLEAMHPHRETGVDVMYVADRQALSSTGFPLMVVRVGSDDDSPFRCRADTLYEIDANLSLANLDWEDFTDQIGASGIYGTDEPASQPGPGPHPAKTTAYKAARDALARIQVDLEDPRGLSGEVVSVRAAGDIPGALSDIRSSFSGPTWLTQGGYHVRGGYRLFAGDVDVPFWHVSNLIVPRDGTIECVDTTDPRPDAVAAIWTWKRRPAGLEPTKAPYSVDPSELETVLDAMTIRFSFKVGQPGADGQGTTRVTVDHVDAPAEWQQHLQAYWCWILERADLDLDIAGVRFRNEESAGR